MSESRWYRADIESAAKAYGLDPDVIEAMVRVESKGLPHAFRYEKDFYPRYLADDPFYKTKSVLRVSSSYGLMQVMYSTARDHGFSAEPEMLFLPQVSLEYGCKHLAWLLKWSKGNLDAALAAYNGGKWKNSPPGPYRNQTYINKVHLALDQVRKERQ